MSADDCTAFSPACLLSLAILSLRLGLVTIPKSSWFREGRMTSSTSPPSEETSFSISPRMRRNAKDYDDREEATRVAKAAFASSSSFSSLRHHLHGGMPLPLPSSCMPRIGSSLHRVFLPFLTCPKVSPPMNLHIKHCAAVFMCTRAPLLFFQFFGKQLGSKQIIPFCQASANQADKLRLCWIIHH